MSAPNLSWEEVTAIGKRHEVPLPAWPTADQQGHEYLSDTPTVDALSRLVQESERLAGELVTLSYWDHAHEILELWVERGRIIRALAEAVGE